MEKIIKNQSLLQIITKILLITVTCGITFFRLIKGLSGYEAGSVTNHVIIILIGSLLIIIPLIIIKNIIKVIIFLVTLISAHTFILVGLFGPSYFFEGIIMFWIPFIVLIFVAKFILNLIDTEKFLKTLTIILSIILIVNIFYINSKLNNLNSIIKEKAEQSEIEETNGLISVDARNKKDASLCNKIQDIPGRDLCLYYFIKETKDYSLCKNFDRCDLKKDCLFNGIKETRAVSLCEEMNAPNQKCDFKTLSSISMENIAIFEGIQSTCTTVLH